MAAKKITARDLLTLLQGLDSEVLDAPLTLDDYNPEWGNTNRVAVERVGLADDGGLILSTFGPSDDWIPTNVATPLLEVD